MEKELDGALRVAVAVGASGYAGGEAYPLARFPLPRARDLPGRAGARRLVGAVPGQESLNEAWVTEQGAGVACAPDAVGSTLEQLRIGGLTEMGARARALGTQTRPIAFSMWSTLSGEETHVRRFIRAKRPSCRTPESHPYRKPDCGGCRAC